MKSKKDTIELKIGELCKTLDKDNGESKDVSLSKQKDTLERLKQNDLFKIKKNKMKSKVQTYDIRDSEDYNGFLTLEVVLRENRSSTIG